MRSLFVMALLAASTSAFADLSPRDIYQKVGPSVVFIFGSGESVGEIGTGSIVDERHVLTNAHVVVQSSTGRPWPSIRVYLKPAKVSGDNKKDLQDPIKAAVVRFDRALDLALLELDEIPGRPPVPMGDSAQVSPGDPVVAIGHPEQGGLWTLTQGVVSTVVADFEKVPGKDVFQTDASINRGNSGGPLLSRDGSMIGVNSNMSRRAPDGTAITSVNFSIESNVVRKWIDGGDVKVGLVTLVEKKEEPKAEPPKAAEAVPAVEPAKPTEPPKVEAPQPKILTPAKPYRADDLISEQIKELEDLGSEMESEIQKYRKN